MEITYDYYRVFYYVAKYKSFTQAAHVLMSNQPNITRFMNNLESQLGCKLLVRSNRGISLTPEGEKLYAHVAIAYEQLKAAELELANDKSLQSGAIILGTSETALYSVLLPVLRQFHKKYPGIHLRISNYSTPQAIQALKNGLMDFSVVVAPGSLAKPFRKECLKKFREIMICGEEYAFLAGEPRSLSELEGYPIIGLSKETRTYDFYTQIYLKEGLLWKPDMEAATADQLLPMVKNGLGIGFIPENFAEEALKKGEVFQIPIKQKIPQREICLVEDTSRHLSISANALKQMLLKWAKEHGEGSQ